MDLVSEVSNKLKENNLYHKVINNRIFTRRSKAFIPVLREDIAYLVGVIAGDGSLIRSKRKRGGEHYFVRITAESVHYLNYLNLLINRFFGISGKVNKDKRKQNTYCLVFQNASLFWYFSVLEAKYNFVGRLPFFCREELFFNHYLGGAY